MIDATETILIVDDSDDDVYALRRALRKAGVANPQQVATNGAEAMAYLQGTAPFNDRALHPLPALVFLDLKMPLCDGFEVLTWMRQQPALAGVIVVVLSGSDELRDHQRAYALGARSYLVKPPQASDLQAIMQSLHGTKFAQPEFRPAL